MERREGWRGSHGDRGPEARCPLSVGSLVCSHGVSAWLAWAPQSMAVSARPHSRFLHAAGLASDRTCRKLPGLSRVRPRTHTARIQEAPVDVTSSVRGRGGGGRMGGGRLWGRSPRVPHRPNPTRPLLSLPVSPLTDLTVVLIAVVGGGALLLFALGLVICLVKKK